jgi:membrane associated rhomboid family serine protease
VANDNFGDTPLFDETPEHTLNAFLQSIKLPLYFTLAIWLIHIFQLAIGLDLGWWGIYPREAFGLRGILFAPVLHDNWTHLASNTVPFLVSSIIIIYFFPRVAFRSFLLIYLVSGLCVWVFARTGVFHIGLSYVVYGLVSFIFWTGVFRRSARSIVLALLIVLLYSGMVEGVLPTDDVLKRNISWESHLIGAIVGLMMAYFYKDELEEAEMNKISKIDFEKRSFLDPSVFEKTREERRLEAELAEQERRHEAYMRWLEQQQMRIDGE